MSFLCPRAFTPRTILSLLLIRYASSTTTQCLRTRPPTSRLPTIPAHLRQISTTPPRLANQTVEQAKARARSGVRPYQLPLLSLPFFSYKQTNQQR